VAAVCDILSVHLALGPETKGLVNADLLGRLRPGAFLINTSRGEVVDHEALAAAVRERGFAWASTSFANEPSGATGEFRDPLLALPNVYGTHHIGASTDQAQEAIAAETVRIVRSYKDTGRVPNVVNLARRTPATHMLVVRHRDRPGVLAHVFDHLRQAEPERAGDREHRLRRGRGRRGARQPRRRAAAPLCGRIKEENADILDLQVVRLAAEGHG
jgi:D-3-phosphoglycerate dehydrogenase / 2-oxoglutarate reductase